MADEPKKPSTLEMLAVVAGKVSLYLPVGGQVVHFASVGLEELAQFLDTSGADMTELQNTHAEYMRRKAIAADPNS